MISLTNIKVTGSHSTNAAKSINQFVEGFAADYYEETDDLIDVSDYKDGE